MKKELISEISRIQELMGVQKLIVEQGTWLKTLAIKAPRSFDSFMTILKSVRQKGVKITDSELDEIQLKLIEAGGLTDDEIENLMKVLRNDIEVRKILSTTDDFLSDLANKFPDDAVPNTSLAGLSKIKLNPDQIKKISEDAVKALLRNRNHPMNRLYTLLDETFYEAIYGISASGQKLNNVDEVFDLIDDNINYIIKHNVKTGKIDPSIVDPNLLFQQTSEFLRNFSKTKQLLDDMVENKQVFNYPKRTKTVKYGDAPLGLNADEVIKSIGGQGVDSKFLSKYEELLQKNQDELNDQQKQFIKDVDDFKKGIDVNLDDSLEFVIRSERLEELGNTFKILSAKNVNFDSWYVKYFRPLFRWWVANFEVLVDGVINSTLKPKFETYAKEFEKAFGEGLAAYRNVSQNPTKLDPYYLFKIKDRLLKLRSEIILDPAKYSQELFVEDLWKAFKENAVKKLTTQQDIESFQSFCKVVDEQPPGFRSASIRDLFNKASVDEGGMDFKKMSEETSKKIEDMSKTIKNNEVTTVIKDKIGEFIMNSKVLSWFTTGSWKTPREVERLLATQGYRGRTIYYNTLKTIGLRYILVPFVAGLLSAIFDAFQKASNVVGMDTKDKNLFEAYWLPEYIDFISGKSIVEFGFEQYMGKIPGGNEWTDALQIVVPGFADNTIIQLYNRLSYYKDNPGEYDNIGDATKAAAGEKYNQKIIEKNEKLIEKTNDRLEKRVEEVSYDQIIETQQIALSSFKNRVDDLVKDGIIDKEQGEFVKNNMKYVPKLPKDYLKMVKQKQKELVLTKDTGDILNGMNSIFGGSNIDITSVSIPRGVDLGSIVLNGNNVQYLVVLQNRLHYSLPDSVHEKFPKGQEIMWVTPEFNNLDLSTERTYNTIKDFIDIYYKK